MPVARIYASLVEEAEPICADLLARGYNVEVVFPDAVLPNPPDLELRVERCSAEQAIARVEAGGSPSRCVFVTPAKGPRRELLLVEMTVLGTGTDGRHPLMMPMTGPTAGAIPVPVIAPAPGPIAMIGSIPEVAMAPPAGSEAVIESAKVQEELATLAAVLPFRVSAEVIASDLPADGVSSKSELVVEASPAQSLPSQPLPMVLPIERREDLGKDIIAELNSFLAHAPVVERPETLPVRIFQTMRASRGVERARKNWEGWTLAGVAASLVLLMVLGWYAAPNALHRSAAMVERPSQDRPATITAPTVTSARSSGPLLPLAQVSLKSLVLTPQALMSKQLPTHNRRRERRSLENNFTAVDQVRNVGRFSNKIAPALTAPVSTTAGSISRASIKPARNASEVLQSAAMRPAQNVAPVRPVTGERDVLKSAPGKSAPIKRITDLK